jgi:uncharacterized SAM-binding protein YcdF (DUF218 family)
MTRRARVLFVILAVVVIIAIARFAFRSAGAVLVRTDPLAPSDAIIVLGSQRIERTLEAGELYRARWAPRVVLLRVRDLQRRGVLSRLNVTFPVFFDAQVAVLKAMGVPPSAVVEVRETTESTEGEAQQIRDYASGHHFHRVIVVTSTYHTRRASRYIRCLAPNLQVIMRLPREEGADPRYWWQWPSDRVDVVFEYMKWPKALLATGGCR